MASIEPLKSSFYFLDIQQAALSSNGKTPVFEIGNPGSNPGEAIVITGKKEM